MAQPITSYVGSSAFVVLVALVVLVVQSIHQLIATFPLVTTLKKPKKL